MCEWGGGHYEFTWKLRGRQLEKNLGTTDIDDHK